MTASGFKSGTGGRALVKRFGAREEGEEIDDVVFGLIFDAQVLLGERALQRIAEELAQIGDRDEPC
jgi:hypothetical protein